MNPQRSAVPCPQSDRFDTFTVSAGGETGASTGSEEAEEEVASAAATVVATVVALGEVSAGESEAEDETEEKLRGIPVLGLSLFSCITYYCHPS